MPYIYSGAERKQRGVEQPVRGHALLQRRRTTQYQGQQLPRPPAETAGMQLLSSHEVKDIMGYLMKVQYC